MNKVICPACGSEHLNKTEQTEIEQLPLGPEFAFKKEVYTCQSCGESGDFNLQNDLYYLQAQKTAQSMSIKGIADQLSENNGLSMAYIERAYELPVRTITRWKNGDFSSSALALMRTIKTYPFIVHVAAAGFAESVAQKHLVMAGLAAMKAKFEAVAGATVHYRNEQSDDRDNHVFTVSAPIGQPVSGQIAIGG